MCVTENWLLDVPTARRVTFTAPYFDLHSADFPAIAACNTCTAAFVKGSELSPSTRKELLIPCACRWNLS